MCHNIAQLCFIVLHNHFHNTAQLCFIILHNHFNNTAQSCFIILHNYFHKIHIHLKHSQKSQLFTSYKIIHN